MALAFGALVAGAVVLDYGVKSAKGAFSSNTGGGGLAGSPGGGKVKNVKGFPAAVDPLPGAIGSRLDQGIDATGKRFLAPWSGKVVYSSQFDTGWAGGGYVAIQSDSDPSKVYYLAEGIAPIVHVGQHVTAGQDIARPAVNPYNGIIGNIEAGLANPSNPGQPLAQVIGNARQMVDNFYNFLRSLGGPVATSTGGAGHA